jgi:hypothetical protein
MLLLLPMCRISGKNVGQLMFSRAIARRCTTKSPAPWSCGSKDPAAEIAAAGDAPHVPVWASVVAVIAVMLFGPFATVTNGSELRSSSVSPSEKYSCSLSPLMFAKGSTAIECGGGLKAVDAATCFEIQNLSATKYASIAKTTATIASSPAFVERIKRLLSPELSPLSAVSGAAPGLREPCRLSAVPSALPQDPRGILSSAQVSDVHTRY